MSGGSWDTGDEAAPLIPEGDQGATASTTGTPSRGDHSAEEPGTGAAAAGRSGRSGSGSDTADFDPPQAGTEAGSVPEPDPADPVAKERDEYKAALQRLQADFENYKKRMAKQAEEQRERAAESLVEKLLPVLDTADLALTHGGSEDVKQIAASLYAALEKEGLEKIDNAGAPFDPNLHDAVAHEPGDGVSEVAEVFRAGFRWRGRVLRPAMVKVRG